MIVRETSPDVFEQINGNPTLNRLDGNARAPLQTIMADSWSAADRAAYGVFVVEPAVAPEGETITSTSFARVNGVVVQQAETAAYVPQVVSPRQMKLAMLGAGMLDDVEAFVAAADRAVQITWENAVEWRRDDAMVNGMGAAFGLTSPQVDDLFTAAATL
jgi:hypothetical protein